MFKLLKNSFVFFPILCWSFVSACVFLQKVPKMVQTNVLLQNLKKFWTNLICCAILSEPKSCLSYYVAFCIFSYTIHMDLVDWSSKCQSLLCSLHFQKISSHKNLYRNIQTWLIALLHQSNRPYLSIQMCALLHQGTTGTWYPSATQHVFRDPTRSGFENHQILGKPKISDIPVILGTSEHQV